MKVVGFERMSQTLDEEIGSTWIIPPRHSVDDLQEYKDLINNAELNPPAFEDGETAEEQVRRKTAPRKKVVYDDDDGDDAGDFLDDGDNALFPKNLPNKKLVGPDQDRPAKKRRIRRKSPSGSGDELPSDEEDEVRAERARKRHKREVDKQRKIKSALYVSPSDDESDAEGDAEFFRREEEIRQRVTKALASAPTDAAQLQESAVPSAAISEAIKRLMADSGDEAEKSSEDDQDEDEAVGTTASSDKAKTASKKRKSDVMRLGSDDDDDEEMSSPPAKKPAPAPRKKTKGGFAVDSSDEEDEDMEDAAPTSPVHVSDDDEEEEEEADAGQGDSDGDGMQTDDTPLSSNPKRADHVGDAEGERLPLREKDLNVVPQTGLDSDEDGEDDVPVVAKRRPRTKGGFVMDDSDDE